MNESKHEKFKRLAKLRGERVLKDLRLIANLSNTSTYEFNETEVRAIFAAIDEELRKTKFNFTNKKKSSIEL